MVSSSYLFSNNWQRILISLLPLADALFFFFSVVRTSVRSLTRLPSNQCVDPFQLSTQCFFLLLFAHSLAQSSARTMWSSMHGATWLTDVDGAKGERKNRYVRLLVVSTVNWIQRAQTTEQVQSTNLISEFRLAFRTIEKHWISGG